MGKTSVVPPRRFPSPFHNRDVAPQYRLAFLDLDGTLVGETDAISPRTKRALDAARAAGCELVICTGRARYGARRVAAQWSGHAYGVFSNGAVVAEWETGRTLFRTPIDPALVRRAAAAAQDLGAATLCFALDEEGRRVVADGRGAILPAFAERNAERLSFAEDLAREEVDTCTIGAYGPEETMALLFDAWRGVLEPTVRVFFGPDVRYRAWSVYATPADATKAHAAEKVARMLGVPREETLAIGDHTNDMDLLRWAGLGVCMADGHPDARDCADHVTGTLAEDGAALALERFVLGLNDASAAR